MPEHAPSFAILLKTFRKRAGLSQEELARRARMSVRTISDLERGVRTHPWPGTVRLLADALGLSDMERAAFREAADREPATEHTPPGLKQLSVTAQHHVPAPVTALLGREGELTAVRALLGREDVRLVTITGPGGIGKTRVAMEVVAAVPRTFPDGVWWVRLTRLSTPEQVVPAIADALDVKSAGAVPLSAMLRAALRDKHLLLVLDNFEHVAEAAIEIAELLAACPGLTVLTTSRVPLHLRGERLFALRALATPAEPARLQVEELADYAATALFLERAQAVDHEFAATPITAPQVAAICARLEGIPLAIELAAARVTALPLSDLERGLTRGLALLVDGPRDADLRQRTMRATLAWSYDLLSAAEQRLLRRLVVFVGGWTLQTADLVCAAPEGAEPLGMDVESGLTGLADHSLIQLRADDGEPRYSMLHVIREYALEQLAASGELRALRDAHALGCLAHLEVNVRDTFPPAPPATKQAAYHALFLERDNLSTALAWTATHGDVTVGLDLYTGLEHLPFYTPSASEEVVFASGLLERMPRDGQRRGARANAGERVARRWALDWGPGEHVPGHLVAANQVAWSALLRGDSERALDMQSQALQWACMDEHPYLIAFETFRLGEVMLATQHDAQRGIELMQEGLGLLRQIGQPWTFCNLQAMFSEDVLLCAGDEAYAETQAMEALALGEQQGFLLGRSLAAVVLAMIAARRGEVVRAEALARDALWRGRIHHMEMGFATFLLPFVMISREREQHERAARLLGMANTMDARGGRGIFACGRAFVDAIMAPVRVALGEDVWAASVAAGQALRVDEAIAEALGESDGAAHSAWSERFA